MGVVGGRWWWRQRLWRLTVRSSRQHSSASCIAWPREPETLGVVAVAVGVVALAVALMATAGDGRGGSRTVELVGGGVRDMYRGATETARLGVEGRSGAGSWRCGAVTRWRHCTRPPCLGPCPCSTARRWRPRGSVRRPSREEEQLGGGGSRSPKITLP